MSLAASHRDRGMLRPTNTRKKGLRRQALKNSRDTRRRFLVGGNYCLLLPAIFLKMITRVTRLRPLGARVDESLLRYLKEVKAFSRARSTRLFSFRA